MVTCLLACLILDKIILLIEFANIYKQPLNTKSEVKANIILWFWLADICLLANTDKLSYLVPSWCWLIGELTKGKLVSNMQPMVQIKHMNITDVILNNIQFIFQSSF